MRSITPRHYGATIVVAILIWALPAAADTSDHWRSKVDEFVLMAMNDGLGEFLVILSEQADLSHAAELPDKTAKGRYVFETLRSVAVRTQPPLITALEAAGVDYQTFWIANLIWVQGDKSVLEMLARRDDVARVHANPRVRLAAADGTPAPDQDWRTRSVEWNIAHVNGPDVWAQGNTGQGAVVGGVDTGYDWDHPALIAQYRGWAGEVADHDYNWHDAVHSGGGACGADSPEPCDDSGHGTHTMGTMIGDDGGENQIGLAPGARWIGCRCIAQGYATPATFIECLEWMVAPYPVGGAPEEGDPARAPHVINNSWGCPESAGCSWDTLLPAIQAVRAAGIAVVASVDAGGPGCASIELPPAIYEESLTVSATDDSDFITSFSSRGPVVVDGSGRLKPDVCAPAVAVRSSWPGGGYSYLTGTSTAAPLVAGLVALLVAADTNLAGDVDQLESLITSSAVPLISGQCGDGDAVPNNVYGHGRIDALAACDHATVGVEDPAADHLPLIVRLLPNAPNPFNPLTTISFELPEPTRVTLRIFDVSGRLVRVLMGGRGLAAGRHEVVWNGEDESGRQVAAGVYRCRLEAGSFSETRLMALVK